METTKERTGLDIDFMSLKIAHDLPEVQLATWTFHDKAHKDGSKFLRCTAVTILTRVGKIFTGISVCSELDTFSRKEGFNRAYGLACQKLTAYLRSKGEADGDVKMEAPLSDINKWITNHAYMMKLDAIKTVWANRFRLAAAKGVDLNVVGV